jgi:beta-lactam-binding protein with PASTA domain
MPPSHVPKVVGQLLPKAKKRIVRAHCRLGRVTRKPSAKKKKNHVLAQTPKAGRRLANGARVNLTIGRGRKR